MPDVALLPPPVEIIIRRAVPSVNLWTNREHGRRVYVTERAAWAMLIRTKLRPRLHAPSCRMRVRVTSYRARLLDHANLVGGCKPAIDVLVKMGWLRDDAPRWFDGIYEQHQAPEWARRTVIAIAPAEVA